MNSRTISARFKAQPINLTVIQVYAPTADCDDSEINHFYSMLNDTMKQVPKKDILMIMGDWNAKVGSDNSGYEDIMGRYGYFYGERNDRGDMLLEFALTMIYTFVTPDFNRRTAENGHGDHLTTGPRI